MSVFCLWLDRYRLMFLKITPEEMKQRKAVARKPIVKVAEVGARVLVLLACFIWYASLSHMSFCMGNLCCFFSGRPAVTFF